MSLEARIQENTAALEAQTAALKQLTEILVATGKAGAAVTAPAAAATDKGTTPDPKAAEKAAKKAKEAADKKAAADAEAAKAKEAEAAGDDALTGLEEDDGLGLTAEAPPVTVTKEEARAKALALMPAGQPMVRAAFAALKISNFNQVTDENSSQFAVELDKAIAAAKAAKK